MSYINELQDVIEHLHNCKASYVEAVPVKEFFKDEMVWDGDVEVFNLYGHPKATRAYAWAYETKDTNEPRHYVTVLHITPVTSPQLAVKAAIIQEHRDRERKQEN